ncbi:MAG: S-adenosylmethionine:tRNA ribosyltransferase-isomerase [Actinomycetota bacterium]|nr:S-adenosylmethionine:tRNA ribosyltransferase-isomerase [Actinomycetota bacterium]
MSEAVVNAADYQFDLPEELIAQQPPEASGGRRDDARLAVVHRDGRGLEERTFRDLGDYLGDADVLVLNNARVVPTLLRGQDEDGRAVAVSVHSPTDDGTWHCLVAAATVCRSGALLSLGPEGEIGGRLLYEIQPGSWRIALDAPDAETVYRAADPIYPGYLKQAPADPEYYQTAYASRPGAVLFPSAGRHFTPAMFDEFKARGMAIVEVTLFIAARSHYWVRTAFKQMVDAGVLGDAEADAALVDAAPTPVIDFPRPERYEITAAAADTINERRQKGGRLFVVGTSALRTLETVADDTGLFWPQTGFTQLTIAPGHRFRACDAFVTNLHRPGSSELVLTSAFAGRERLLDVYRTRIVPDRYRFYEFGDSMLIL